MNTQSDAMSESVLGSQVIVPVLIRVPRRMYWSLRRELWESRSIYLAPLAVAGIVLFGFSLGTIAGIWEKSLRLDPTQREVTAQPYDIAAALMMLTAILVSVFYCLDALHGERRDRSILFWKSLPISDLNTVLTKASIPLIVLPLITFVIALVTQCIMLLLSSAVLVVRGMSVAPLWGQLPLLQMSLLLLYHLFTAHALWPAPIYCWLLLVSGWARRAVFLWAALPLLAIGGVEKIAFHTSHFAAMLLSRISGDAPAIVRTGPNIFPTNPMTHITPINFLSSSGLWIGLAIAAAFLAAAVRLRRCQGPI